MENDILPNLLLQSENRHLTHTKLHRVTMVKDTEVEGLLIFSFSEVVLALGGDWRMIVPKEARSTLKFQRKQGR